ncbi:MAG: hypothetical protein AAFU85_11260 [Planctomycetota bacterium]
MNRTTKVAATIRSSSRRFDSPSGMFAILLFADHRAGIFVPSVIGQKARVGGSVRVTVPSHRPPIKGYGQASQ